MSVLTMITLQNNVALLQVEHCYPELVPGRPTELPPSWRHLPALALPDGSHNYLSDTIYFHLPGITEPAHTVYGISCFRQIPIEVILCDYHCFCSS